MEVRSGVVDLMVAAGKWRELGVEKRRRIMKKVMPGPTWAALRETMATMEAERMTQIQLESLPDLLKYVGRVR